MANIAVGWTTLLAAMLREAETGNLEQFLPGDPDRVRQAAQMIENRLYADDIRVVREKYPSAYSVQGVRHGVYSIVVDGVTVFADGAESVAQAWRSARDKVVAMVKETIS